MMYFRYHREEKRLTLLPQGEIDNSFFIKLVASVMRHGDFCSFGGRCLPDWISGKPDGAPIFLPSSFNERLKLAGRHDVASSLFIDCDDTLTRQALVDFFEACPSGETYYLWPGETDDGLTTLVFEHL